MDKRLVLTVLFMILSWMFVGTSAQNTAPTTAAVTGNKTAAPNTTAETGNHTTAAPAAGNHTTAAPNTAAAAAGNHTTAAPAAGNHTTAAPAAGNHTTAAPAAGNHTTAAPAAGNHTTAAPAAGNHTTAAPAAGNHTTAAPNTTAVTGNHTTAAPAPAPTTTAAPLMPNTTVTLLVTPVSKADCGSTQLCVAEPSDCDPSQSGSCFFLGTKQTSGRNFEFSLSGESTGYVATSLSLDVTPGGNDSTYICANNNGELKFFGALLNNGQLTVTELNVNSVKGSVNGNKIQCTFAATVPAQTTRAQAFSLSVSTGSFNSTSNDLGPPTATIRTPVVNLANPNATVTNELAANTTTAPTTPTPTTSHAITLQQSLTQALLVTVGVLSLAML